MKKKDKCHVKAAESRPLLMHGMLQERLYLMNWSFQSQTYLHPSKEFFIQFSLTYNFDILNNILCHDSAIAIKKHYKRGVLWKYQKALISFSIIKNWTLKKNTILNYEFILSRFQKHFGDVELSSITSDDILDFMTKISGNTKQNTKRLRFTSLGSIFQFFQEFYWFKFPKSMW